MEADDNINTEHSPTCVVCGARGAPRFRDLKDRVFGAPGAWTMKMCESETCGTLWLDPRPTQEDIGKAYRCYFTHSDAPHATLVKRLVRMAAREYGAVRYGYASSRVPWPGRYLISAATAIYPGLRDHLDLLIRYLPQSGSGAGTLLDVGCGDGQALEVLQDLGWQAQGIDVDESAIASARSRGLCVQVGTLTSPGFAAETFDVVTSSHVIEHVHEPREFLSESRRILRTGGTVVTVTPNARSWSIGRFGVNSLSLDPPRHLVLFTAESLRMLGKSVGFEDVHVTSTARAVAFAEIAGSSLRDKGKYRWGSWPGILPWVRGQIAQFRATTLIRRGIVQGEELVMIARK